MNKKIIFFDVDGTLVDVRPAREYVPESTIKAVRETRKKGNLCFLCTGRSLAEIYPHILDVGFDGIIGAGGGFVTIGDEMLYHKKVSNKDVHRVVDFFEENDYDYYLESNGGLFASENLVSRLEMITYGDLGDDSGELSVVGVNKASAIEALINHLNIPQENTFAFGDGMNDADMLEYCHIGIAVDNAKEGLKAIADEVCDDIAEDGIYKTMKKYQLI